MFCECKKGLHSIKLIEKTNVTTYLVVNCDISAVVSPSQIDESKLGENQFTLDYFTNSQQQKSLGRFTSFTSLVICLLSYVRCTIFVILGAGLKLNEVYGY